MSEIPIISETKMVGGYEFQGNFLKWVQQTNHLYLAVFSIIIFMWAIYAEKLPEIMRWQLSTSIGRMLLLIILYIILIVAGWIPAVLAGIAIALTWANRPIHSPIPPDIIEEHNEGYADNIKQTKIETSKWFVEEVLQENPKLIIQDRVTTSPVQEDNTAPSRSSR